MIPVSSPNSYPNVSWWQLDVSGSATPERRPLPGDIDVDVAIVGAGYTGLWTAYHLARQQPDLRIVVLERATVGFGASGRNGGWCSAIMPVGLDALDRRHGSGAGARLQRAMITTVDELDTICREERIDAHYDRGGWLQLARNPAQVRRIEHELDEAHRHGFGDDHLHWLDPRRAREHLDATQILGASYSPNCAALHPARLAHGLANAVERRGVTIHEGTAVVAIEPRLLRTTHGRVRADVVIRATEAYTRDLPGHRRTLVPIYSLMIVTAPIPSEQWARLGLEGRATFSDARHVVIYGQRTQDGRIALGGRGAPYHFASRIDPRFDRHDRVRRALRDTLVEMLPALAGVEIEHHWGGPLGIPRDWHPSISFDRSTGLAHAGGYVGDGVATSLLAGQTLADLVLGHETDRTTLPLVGHDWTRWEPEPVRWAAINSAMHLAEGIDTTERRGGRARLRSTLLDRLTGH